MNEAEFQASIDCRFPYTDEDRAHGLIEIALSLSPGSVFEVVHELARPGRYANAPRDVRHQLLDRIDAKFEHPAKEIVFPVARVMIDDGLLPVAEAVAAMKELAPLGRLGSALNILYMSCDDLDGQVEDEYDRIVAEWRSAAG